MVRRRVAEAAQAMEGQVISGDPTVHFEGGALDSRKVAGGELFFALSGERTDGHGFVGEALRRGAAAAVVHRDPDPSEAKDASSPGTLIRVAHTYEALHALTRWIRRDTPRHLAAITGSVGKTTTKELLAAMLARRYRVARSPGNLNNLYGFPLALLGIADDTEWMVAEMGMSEAGELGQISRLGRPDVAVFTNVRPAHLESFGQLRGIARAKAELLEGLAAGPGDGPEPEPGTGFVVANAGDPEVVWIARRYLKRDPQGKVVWYGFETETAGLELDLRASEVRSRRAPGVGSRFVLTSAQGEVEVELPLHGGYNVENCLAAAACAHRLGVPLAEISQAVRKIEPVHGRGVVHSITGGAGSGSEARLVDDSYNSNPDALSKALIGARGLEAKRHWAVLGEMLELGAESPRFHRQAGEEAARLGFEPIVGVGELAREIVAGARSAGVRSHWCPDAPSTLDWVRRELRSGDLVLVKGSRGVGLEVVVEGLLALAGGEN